MVLERLIADIIIKHGEKYFENLNRENLKVAMFKGHVVLENLEIRRDALAALGIPVIMVKGVIGELRIVIPFHQLRSQAVAVNVDKMFIHLSRVERYNETEFRAGARHAKDEAAQAQLQQLVTARVLSEEEKKGTFTTRLIHTVLENIRITCTNIHIRYEDAYTDPMVYL
eukprot:c37521_g1_i1.p1 GENE.c37521_g1_i1~~c37521_g1_i1.p1  ORF type:complete len:184 (+),score=55.15 c37521_g1_i1:43-552(+)